MPLELGDLTRHALAEGAWDQAIAFWHPEHRIDKYMRMDLWQHLGKSKKVSIPEARHVDLVGVGGLTLHLGVIKGNCPVAAADSVFFLQR